jgi:hypothetical protein
MLRVSIHAGPLRDINRFNRVDWLDIGYEKLDAAANYKIVLFNVGKGATPVIPLSNYPRWSASLWDLTARAIALALSPDPKNRKEEVEPVEPHGQRYAYAREVRNQKAFSIPTRPMPMRRWAKSSSTIGPLNTVMNS